MTDKDVMRQFRAASPVKQQIFIAALIHHLTILARDFYDSDDAANGLQRANEHTHRLVGHLLSIARTNTTLEDLSAAAIEQVVLQLHPTSQQKLASFLDDPNPN